ncbi:MAG: hypothetical protein ACLQF1_20990 [Methyloceanibacter sp.]|jgi:hypothetical protein
MENQDDDEGVLPFVVTYDTGRLPEGVAMKITYSTSAERHATRQWDNLVFGMSPEIAIGLARALIAATEEPSGPEPKATRQ